MEKYLHIICLNVPYPVDYGGVFDLFYKLPALQRAGVKIHLHCFEYGRGEQIKLDAFCESVQYYKRKKPFNSLSVSLPYIVKSRVNKILTENLLKDNYPILMEGVHCTYLLNDQRFKGRRNFVRLHNVEHIYYRHLFAHSTSLLKKLYFFAESVLLAAYEKKIATRATFLTVAKKDLEAYKRLGSDKVHFLPLFLPPWKVVTPEGKGSFCLYHGDLSVAENETAVILLLKEIFNEMTVPFVIAGKNPTKKIVDRIGDKNWICLIENPDEAEMQDLIAKAHINILPSYNETGIKLKFLNALFNGRHCLANQSTVEGTGFEHLCTIANDAESMKSAISELFNQPFLKQDVELRKQILEKAFDNETNAGKLVDIIWS